MALNINGTTGISGVDGSVSAPAVTGTDSNTGITFPAADTIKFSTGGVERMSITNSGVTGTGIGAGKILQVVQTVKLDTFSTTSTSDVDVTGLSVAITPSSSSSKILVMVSIALSSQGMFVYGILKRGSTQIGEADGAGNRLRPTLMSFNSNEGTVEHHSFTFLDSPNTTSATTYKMQIRCATSGNAVVNKSYRDTDGVNNDPRVSSTITVQEVAA